MTGFLVILLEPNRLVIDTTPNLINFVLSYPSEKKGLLYCQSVSDIEKVKALVKPLEQDYQLLLDINATQNTVDIFNENIQKCIQEVQSIANKYPVVVSVTID